MDRYMEVHSIVFKGMIVMTIFNTIAIFVMMFMVLTMDNSENVYEQALMDEYYEMIENASGGTKTINDLGQ